MAELDLWYGTSISIHEHKHENAHEHEREHEFEGVMQFIGRDCRPNTIDRRDLWHLSRASRLYYLRTVITLIL